MIDGSDVLLQIWMVGNGILVVQPHGRLGGEQPEKCGQDAESESDAIGIDAYHDGESSREDEEPEFP